MWGTDACPGWLNVTQVVAATIDPDGTLTLVIEDTA